MEMEQNKTLKTRISEATDESEKLAREQAKTANEDGALASQQMVMWRGLFNIFEAKLRVARSGAVPIIRPAAVAAVPVVETANTIAMTTTKVPKDVILATIPIAPKTAGGGLRTTAKPLQGIR
jgi:hypothetical protein